MARRASHIGLVLVLVAVLCAGASAQSSGCTSALVSLSPCLDYITGNETTPSSSCCSQLASVVGSEPQCLCMVLNGGDSSLGITINQTQALALPTACNVKTPPVSECSCKHITQNSVTTATVCRNVSRVLAATFCLLAAAGAPSGSPTTPSVPSAGTTLFFSHSCEFSDSSEHVCRLQHECRWWIEDSSHAGHIGWVAYRSAIINRLLSTLRGGVSLGAVYHILSLATGRLLFMYVKTTDMYDLCDPDMPPSGDLNYYWIQ